MASASVLLPPHGASGYGLPARLPNGAGSTCAREGPAPRAPCPAGRVGGTASGLVRRRPGGTGAAASPPPARRAISAAKGASTRQVVQSVPSGQHATSNADDAAKLTPKAKSSGSDRRENPLAIGGSRARSGAADETAVVRDWVLDGSEHLCFAPDICIIHYRAPDSAGCRCG